MKKIAMMLLMLAAIGGLDGLEIPLQNAEFKAVNGEIPGWRWCTPRNNGGEVESVPYEGREDFRALKLSCAKECGYFGMAQFIRDLTQLPVPGAGEELRFSLEFRQKNQQVADGGFVSFIFYAKDGKILAYCDSQKSSGTFDWGDRSVSGLFPGVPAGAAYFAVRLFLGKSTGTVWFAEPKLYVDVVKK